MKMSYSEYVPSFKALADESRMKIIDMLSGGTLCACDILEELSITQSTLSYHMKILTDSGIVNSSREGAWVQYSLNQEKMGNILSFLTEIAKVKERRIASSCKTKGCPPPAEGTFI